MNTYEFAYDGPPPAALNDTLTSCRARPECILETTALLLGSRLRISGPDEIVREAIRTVRGWIHNTI